MPLELRVGASRVAPGGDTAERRSKGRGWHNIDIRCAFAPISVVPGGIYVSLSRLAARPHHLGWARSIVLALIAIALPTVGLVGAAPMAQAVTSVSVHGTGEGSSAALHSCCGLVPGCTELFKQ